jgi:hypothetical protein
MLTFFDYVYYTICRYYYKNNDKGARISALALLSLIQCFNLFSLFVIFDLLKYLPDNRKYIAVFSYILLLILNGIRYNKFNFDVLDEKWGGEKVNTKKKKNFFIGGYFILSIIIVVILIFRNS